MKIQRAVHRTFWAWNLGLLLSVGGAGCSASGSAVERPPRAPQVSNDAPAPPVQWTTWGQEAFERAKREDKIVLVDVGLEGCTACREMHFHTYTDAGVRRLLQESFVSVAVDADQQPDLGAKYDPWGWPATIFISPEGEQLMAVSGSRPPKSFQEILQSVRSGTRQPPPRPVVASAGATSVQGLCAQMLERFDAVANPLGWGGELFVVTDAPVEYSLWRADAANERNRLNKVERVAEGLLKLIDPVEGGVFLGAADNFTDIIPEKRTLHQSRALLAFTEMYHRTRQPRWLAAINDIHRYMRDKMRDERGAFFSTQADRPDELPASVQSAEYWRWDAEKRAEYSEPSIDRSTYTDQTALMIHSYAKAYRATGNAEFLEFAVQAAEELSRRTVRQADLTYVRQTSQQDASASRLRSAAKEGPRLYLLSQVRLARALLSLNQATGDAVWLQQARQLANSTLTLEDKSGGFFASTVRPTDPLAQRTKPHEANVEVVRLFSQLAALEAKANSTGEQKAKYLGAAERTLVYLGTPPALRLRGPQAIASYALALDEFLAGPLEISIVTKDPDAAAKELYKTASRVAAARGAIKYEPPGRYPDKGRTSVFVCTKDRCSSPIFEPEKLSARILDFQTSGVGACQVAR